jgi:hypothetical protein
VSLSAQGTATLRAAQDLPVRLVPMYQHSSTSVVALHEFRFGCIGFLGGAVHVWQVLTVVWHGGSYEPLS